MPFSFFLVVVVTFLGLVGWFLLGGCGFFCLGGVWFFFWRGGVVFAFLLCVGRFFSFFSLEI